MHTKIPSVSVNSFFGDCIYGVLGCSIDQEIAIDFDADALGLCY